MSCRGADDGPAGTVELEPLVLLLLALHGRGARTLLAGLDERARSRAAAILGGAERRGRGERHAALALAFSSPPPPPGTGADVPGLLGERVRAVLAGGGGRAPAGSARLERWARRLARELAARPPSAPPTLAGESRGRARRSRASGPPP